MRVIIMSGIPGSGKSTWAEENCPGAVVCSADSYFVGLGRNFHPAKLPDAHRACLQRFIETLRDDYENNDGEDSDTVVIVDNTNTTAVEMAPYVAIASAYCVTEIEIVEMDCPVGLAAKRNIHNVPMRTCLRMGDNLMSLEIPRFWNVKRTEVKTY